MTSKLVDVEGRTYAKTHIVWVGPVRGPGTKDALTKFFVEFKLVTGDIITLTYDDQAKAEAARTNIVNELK